MPLASVLALPLLGVLTGCAGMAVVHESVQTYDTPPFALDRRVGFFEHDDYNFRQRGLVIAATKEDVLNRWGAPARRSADGASERWHYKREIGWSGMIAFVIVPIPLLVPVGYRETVVEFSGDSLVKMSRAVGRQRGGVCGIVAHHNLDIGCVAFR